MIVLAHCIYTDSGFGLKISPGYNFNKRKRLWRQRLEKARVPCLIKYLMDFESWVVTRRLSLAANELEPDQLVVVASSGRLETSV